MQWRMVVFSGKRQSFYREGGRGGGGDEVAMGPTGLIQPALIEALL
jgi:hypothetical protein